MVTTLNITLDDPVADEVRDLKDRFGLTWAEYIAATTEWAPDPAPRETAVEASPSREQRRSRPPDPTPDPDTSPPSRETSPQLEESARDSVPGHGPKYDERVAVLEEMLALLKVEGRATKEDFLDLVDPDDVQYASEESFWSNVVKTKKPLQNHPNVNSPKEGNTIWRWNE